MRQILSDLLIVDTVYKESKRLDISKFIIYKKVLTIKIHIYILY